jgi:hypothetical protein
MPGFDTLVAGYLLPIIATEVPTVRDGVAYNGGIYHHAASGIEPGYTVAVRAWQHTGRPQAVFVSYGDPPGLRYLEIAREV